MALLCPAGHPSSFKAAIEQGADAVFSLKDETNVRHFTGLNFTEKSFKKPSSIPISTNAKSILPLIPLHIQKVGKGSRYRRTT